VHGIDLARGGEPGNPVVRRIVSPKDAALEDARAAGLLQIVEGRYSVHKYDGEVSPDRLYEIVECPPNLFLTAGITKLWNLIAGVSATHLDATNTRLAVGDSSTAAAAGQTDLLGTNKFRKLVTGAPVISNNQITFSSQFETGEANFAWLEVGVADSGTAGAQLISRTAITSPGLGTKVNTAVWVLNWTLSIS
jgi:hypothetical protein